LRASRRTPERRSEARLTLSYYARDREKLSRTQCSEITKLVENTWFIFALLPCPGLN